MPKSWFRGKCLTLVVCLWTVLPLRAVGAEGTFQHHIAEAVRLYEGLEFEQALEQLERASKMPHGTDEAVTLGLYKGIVSADLRRWDAAREEFRSALMLKPDAKLPLRVSPKVTTEFESQRTKVNAELARQRMLTMKLAESRPTASVSRPELAASEPAQGNTTSTAPREQVARPDLVPSPSEQSATQMATGNPWTRRVPVASMVLLGAGVAAGGAGTYFGLSSRSQLDEARGAQDRAMLEDRHGQAQRSATTANVLFGTAGLAIAGAVVTWFLMEEPGTAVAQGGAR